MAKSIFINLIIFLMIDKKEITNLVVQFGETLETQWKEEQNVGILGGKSGIALFLYDLSAFLNDQHFANIADNILYDCFDCLNEGYNFPTFCSGIAGLGWTLEHLQNRDIISIEDENMLDKIDEFIYEKMTIDFANNNFDYLHGAIGYGFYFMKRCKNAKNANSRKKFIQYLGYSINEIEKLAKKDTNGLGWLSSQILTSFENRITYNLSLSHGMASIIGYLTRVSTFPELSEKCSSLINGSIGFIQQFRREDSTWNYPHYISQDKSTYDNSVGRLAWCYGDLGLGLTLYNVGNKLMDKGLIKTSLQTLQKCALKTDVRISDIIDAGLCHGAFGVAYIFQKIANETNEAIYSKASQFWLDQGLLMKIDDKVSGGFQHWLPDGWKNSYGILNGISGIGLSLLSILGINNNWDECLMLDLA
jgi:lantibiotic modifying enzyme